MKTRFQIESEIRGLQQLLSESDYQALKHADGALTDEEYDPIRLQRQSYREKINKLEGELKNAPDDGSAI